MTTERLIVAIGRIERALSRIERLPAPAGAKSDHDLVERHEKLKAETHAAIADLDRILAGAQ